MFEEIKALLIEKANIDADKITPTANLKHELGIDSLSSVELTLDLEEHYGIQIEWEEMQNVVTVSDVVELIEKKVGR